MALPSSIQAILARFRGSNNNAYNASTNPLGLGQGGHRQNFGPRLQDTANVVDWMSGAVDAVDADATQTAADRVQTGQDRTAASNSATAAAQSATDAAGQALRLLGTSTTSQTPSVASKTFTTQAGKSFDVGTSVLVQSRSDINRWMTGRVTAYSDTSLTVSVEAIGSVTTAANDWDIRVSGARGAQGIQGIPGIATMPYLARTSNTQIVAGNSATIFDLTGTFTQTFAACASLGANWYAVLRNNGTGDITLDPNGSETIDGLTSFIMYPGEARLVQCDGTALRSIVLEGFTKVFAASDNFIKPPGYSQFGGILRSGGAGGVFNSNTGARAEGGPGGGAFPFTIPAASLPASSPVVIGAGGTGGTVNAGSPNSGGDSTFAGLSVLGGRSALGGAINGASTSGASTSADFGPSAQNSNGAKALYGGGSADNSTGGTQGSSIYGGGCGGQATSGNVAAPNGTSTFAGAGGAANLSGAGGNGVAPSGGGGASRISPAGAGARGQLDIWGMV